MIGSELHWNAQHYGKIVADHEDEIQTECGKYNIRVKIYKYETELYIETWCNGIVITFNYLPL